MQESDLIRITHMRDASAEIIAFTKGKNRDDFHKDRKLNLCVVHLLEIIGEAASSVSATV